MVRITRQRSLWSLSKKGWKLGGRLWQRRKPILFVQEKGRWGLMGCTDYLRRDEWHLSVDGLKQEK